MSQYTPEQMSLYYFGACPFCKKVIDTMKSLNLDIELRDVRATPQHGEDLKAATGKSMVPCLRIEKDANNNGGDTWMHESGDIAAFLKKTFG